MARKPFVTAVFTATTLTLAGCSGAGAPSGEAATAPADPGSVSGDITVLTQRTDLVQNGTMKKYATEFNKAYPKVKVKFQGITDYEGEVKIRMNTENYGDVLMIPAAISKDDYPKFFAPLGSTAQLSKRYRFTDKTGVNGKVYGIASFGTANGFVYNKAVWKKAGVTQWPATPRQFITDLRKIKAGTDSVPYYTNFKDMWPLTAWTNNLGSVSCDPQSSNKLVTTDSPWAPGSDLNVIDTLLYDIVHDKLSEKDPTTTNWESSKTLITQGKIASMQLGSWAITQMQDAARKAGAGPDDIGFMPFPAQKNGKFCATLLSDYQQAVNAHSQHKAAARAWIDWFTDKSGYAQTEGAVSALKSAPMPDTLKAYTDSGVQFVERSEADTGKVNSIDDAAEIGLSKPDYRQKLVDLARGAQKGSLDDFLGDLDKRWNEARKTAGS
ncbi:ABC transporter substrate-binding protein [Streptomyces kaempferi]|uniref:ABC transporter substrate-binding protein n=1 Tax=Streptomyces kaempferi TaxID=333725 RepID=A0ABW3XCZ8_9ACTN